MRRRGRGGAGRGGGRARSAVSARPGPRPGSAARRGRAAGGCGRGGWRGWGGGARTLPPDGVLGLDGVGVGAVGPGHGERRGAVGSAAHPAAPHRPRCRPLRPARPPECGEEPERDRKPLRLWPAVRQPRNKGSGSRLWLGGDVGGRSAFAPALLRFGGRDRGACRAQHLTHTHTHTAGGLEGRAADAPPPRSLLQGLNDRARLWLGGDVPSGRVGRRARAGRACTRGTEKASVLPDPVGASMSTSRCMPGRRDRPLLLDLVFRGRVG